MESKSRFFLNGDRVVSILKASFITGDDVLLTLQRGTFSSVVRAVHNASKLPVAIKIIDKTKIENPKQLSRIHNEIALHKKCKHPNIVSFLEAHETSIDVCIVMEL